MRHRHLKLVGQFPIRPSRLAHFYSRLLILGSSIFSKIICHLHTNIYIDIGSNWVKHKLYRAVNPALRSEDRRS